MSIFRRIGETVQSLGLAMYALLLLAMFGASSCCAVGSLWGIINGQLGDPDEVDAGTDLLPNQLSLLWQSGVVPTGERPDIYHDATMLGDGREGCLVHNGDLVRWQLAQPTQRLPIAGATVSVTEAPSVVLRQGESEVECIFYGVTGRDRFARMLESEAKRPAPAGATP